MGGASRSERADGLSARAIVAVVLTALAVLATLGQPRQATGGSGVVKVIGTATSTSTVSNTMTITVPASGVAAGNSIIVTIALADPNHTADANCTDTTSNSYTKNVSFTGDGVTQVVCLANNVAALSSGNTITITIPPPTTPAARAATALELTGFVTASSPVDEFHSANTASPGNANPSATLLASTGQANELLLGVVVVLGPATYTFTPGTNGTANTCANTGTTT